MCNFAPNIESEERRRREEKEERSSKTINQEIVKDNHPGDCK
jgi:hypothetical protein